MRRAKGHSADGDLAKLFDALAPVLIPLDVTPSRLAQVARASFVKAGAKQAQLRSGRPHLARIAALTGLSRSEVKRLVASGYKSDASKLENLPRALRVLNAWRDSSIYTAKGRPRRLKILGKAPSFDALCKAHSGDIPYTVIMDEIERRKCVVVTRKHNQIAISRLKKSDDRTIRELSALSFAAAFLQDALQDKLVLVRRKQKIASSSALSDAYVETAIANRLTDLLDQLPGLFANRAASKRNIVNVFTLVSKAKT
jgi:hypothetical protein